MKKGLIFGLVMVMALTMAASAKKMDPRTNLVTKDGDAPVVKTRGSKLPSVGVLVSATGYADAWRATASMAGKSIVVDPTGNSIGMAFGTAGAACNLLFGYSMDGGSTWGTHTLASNMNTRIYNGLALDAFGYPYIIWQDRTNNSIQWSCDYGGIGGGLWSNPDTLARDSVAWYIPSLAISGNKIIMSAFSHGAAVPYGDFSIHAVLSNDLGSTWTAPYDRHALPGGWNKFCDNEISGTGWSLDEADWLISGSGDTVVAYLDLVGDTAAYNVNTYSGFYPAYKISTDGGLSWGAMQKFDLPPQYNYGGWWYMYDGAWIGDRPYLLFTHQDGGFNGNALFIYFPTVAGDYSNWTCKRISDIPGTLAGVIPGDLNGSGVNFPTLSSDAAGNIFATYRDRPKDSDNYEIFGVASTDHGATWLNPVRLTNQGIELTGTTGLIYLEAAEIAGGDKIHMLYHDPAYTNIYYWNVPTSIYLAGGIRPEEISLAPELVPATGGGLGGPVDATMDIVSVNNLIAYWSPKVALDGTYEVQISKTSDFSLSAVNNTYQWFNAGLNVNYILSVGLPATNRVWYWRVRSVKGSNSPWSAVFDFNYQGTAINITNWTNISVVGISAITAAPASFNVTLIEGDSTNRTITIGNTGTGDLEYGISNDYITPFKSAAKEVPFSTTAKSVITGNVSKGVTINKIYPQMTDGKGGPDAYGYGWKDSNEPGGPVFSWIDASGGTTIPMGDDQMWTGMPLGFIFKYYENGYSTINIGTNGWMSFNGVNGSYPGSVPSLGDGFRGAIVPFAWDLYPPGASYVRYKTFGTAPNRYFVVEYNNVPNYSGGNYKTFEVIFYEGSGKIRFQYLVAPDDPVSIGIESPDEMTGMGNAGVGDLFISPSVVQDNYAIEFGPFGWMSETPFIGTVVPSGSGDVTVKVNALGILPGEYDANIVIDNNDPVNNPKTVPVHLTVLANQGPVVVMKSQPASPQLTPGPYLVQAVITDLAKKSAAKSNVADSLYYRVSGGSFAGLGVSSQAGDTFNFYIPAIDTGVVEFYIQAWDNVSAFTMEPSMGYHSFLVDTVHPMITYTYPADGDSNVALNAPVKMAFSEPIDTSSFMGYSSPDHSFTLSWNATADTLTLSPDTLYGYNITYTLSCTTGTDLAGNPIAGLPVSFSFTAVPTGINGGPGTQTFGLQLNAAAPNPVIDGRTIIKFSLPASNYAKLEVYNVLGQKMITLIDRKLEAGYHAVNWSGTDANGTKLASGVYLYQLKTMGRTLTKRLTIIR